MAEFEYKGLVVVVNDDCTTVYNVYGDKISFPTEQEAIEWINEQK